MESLSNEPMEPNGTVDERKSINKVIKITLIVLLFTLGVFLVWAAFFPISQGAPAYGKVTIANYRKVVQHQYGGTVKEILVKEGDEVKKGQVLIKLEDSDIKARYMSVKLEYLSSLLTQARLQAERAFMDTIVYPREVLEMKNDPEVRRLMSVQESLFMARRTKLETEKRVILESINGLKEYVQNLQKQADYYVNQLNLVNRQIESLKGLTAEGYYPRNRLLELERLAEDLRGKLAELRANKAKAEATINEYQMRIHALEREYIRGVETELAEVERRIPALRDAYIAVADMLDKTEIKAPEDGIVMALMVHTIGQVITPGQIIMEIVPKNAELLVEGRLSPIYVEEVKPGQTVDLRFPTLDPKITPVLEGELVYLSPDVLYDEIAKGTFYLVRVKIKEESMVKLQKLNKEIIPGLPVEIIIKTGKRPFLSYLLKPFLDRLAHTFLR